MKLPTISIQFKTLPTDPGVYQYFDKNDTVIYIGKAKNLKRRVTSYFTKVHDNAKTRILVKKIHRMEYIVVPSEVDALLLENNLIKKYRPRYNILLKDDKTYPWICIKKEPFPRVFSTRKVIRDGSSYFGPYPNVKTVYTLLELIRGLYPIRTCNYDLSEEKVQKQSYKICLEYHIGNCLAPCEARVSEKDYEENIAGIQNIIKGNFRQSLDRLKSQMEEYSNAMEFERAQQVKEKLESLVNYQAKSTVVSPKITNVDVFSIISDESYGYVNFFKVAFGSIIMSHTVEIKKKLEESDAEMLRLAIVDLRQRFNSQSKEIYVPFEIDLGPKIKVTIPILGDKKKLVELSERNAKFFRLERFKQMKIVEPERHVKRLINQMKTDLRLNVEPVHIECFDNSNIQGTNPTAACVVFRNGKPFKKDYRHFKIKTVEGPDDFASMEEVVHRRYKRLLDEGQSLPQLIVIDGGKGQLSSAVKSLNRLGLRGQIAIIGIAKRLEEIYYPGDSIPMYLDKKSETLKIIQQLRNEAHRFGLTLHRKIRSKSALNSPLDGIEGIGPKTKELLLMEFKSLKRIKAAPQEAIIKLLGNVKGVKIYQKLQLL
ncbi:MAG: excinuclease ABC subunit C [Flavobacteriaceae bacterium TMED179]|nr:MAG: excinuclease ABC subunit C [Flavobacteriaceae bacterium TMED179]|tara:strand:+ start:2513 stop:4306 length:1794 start_codon:yes stop_codon:yes gene_type:complete